MAYTINTQVDARWNNNGHLEWHPAWIEQVNTDGTYNLLWDDKTRTPNVDQIHLRPRTLDQKMLTYPIGTQVDATWNNNGRSEWAVAFITSMSSDGKTYNIMWQQDGTTMQNRKRNHLRVSLSPAMPRPAQATTTTVTHNTVVASLPAFYPTILANTGLVVDTNGFVVDPYGTGVTTLNGQILPPGYVVGVGNGDIFLYRNN